MSTEHLSDYQERDYEVVDYQMSPLNGTDLLFRGPVVTNLKPNGYIACIGAAQTFGCFCDQPFPNLLSKALDMPVLNLGYGGAGPYFYLKHKVLIKYLNQAKLVVVQVMSGRSENNSRFDSGGLELLVRRSDGVKLGANEAYNQALNGRNLLPDFLADQWLPKKLARVVGKRMTKKLVAETRRNWIKNYQSLLSQISAPKVLFWFSKREPEYEEKYSSVSHLFNEFPQLVNQYMIEQVESYSDEYIECITSSGSPQPLFSRFTGEPATVNPANDRQDLAGKVWTHNFYYPSPQMHRDAAQLLMPVCQKYL